MRIRFLPWLTVLLLAASSSLALAQGLTLEIPNGNASAIPVAVVPFAFEGGGLPPETDGVAEVIRGDLNRCGQFRTLAKGDIVEFPTRGDEIKFPTWRLLKQDYIVVGREIENPNGEVRVEFELYTVGNQHETWRGWRSAVSAATCAASRIRLPISSTRKSPAGAVRSGLASPTSPRRGRATTRNTR